MTLMPSCSHDSYINESACVQDLFLVTVALAVMVFVLTVFRSSLPGKFLSA